MKTWHIEGAVVFAVLLFALWLGGNTHNVAEWFGVVAVQLTFHHAAIANRMAEQQERLPQPSVSCFQWSTRLFAGKEIIWLMYFVGAHAYSALVGCIVFLLYPIWRYYYRKRFPLLLHGG